MVRPPRRGDGPGGVFERFGGVEDPETRTAAHQPGGRDSEHRGTSGQRANMVARTLPGQNIARESGHRGSGKNYSADFANDNGMLGLIGLTVTFCRDGSMMRSISSIGIAPNNT